MTESTQSQADEQLADINRQFGAEQAMKMVGSMAVHSDEAFDEPIGAPTPLEVSLCDAETIAAMFKFSENAINEIRYGDTFQEFIAARGIHPYKQSGEQPYWIALNDFVNRKTSGVIEMSEIEQLQARTMQLLAATPNFIFADALLGQNTDKRHTDRVAVSTYNGLVRDLAVAYPNLTASALSNVLVNSLQATMQFNAPPLPQAAAQVNKCIRGAQHELAYGALLKAGGLPYRITTVAEDLKGIDYVVLVDGKETKVDVKASLSEIEANMSQGAYVLRRDKVLMYSMVTDSELCDRFVPPPEITAQRAPVVALQLQDAVKRMHAHTITA